MTESKKIHYVVAFFISYLLASALIRLSILPMAVNQMLSIILLTALIVFMVAILIYSIISFWNYKRFDSFMLLIFSAFFTIFSSPFYIKLIYMQVAYMKEARAANQFAEKIVDEVKQVEQKMENKVAGGIFETTDKKDFEQFLEANKNNLVVIKVSAVWCPPCQQIKPVFKEIAHNMAGKAKFVALDADKYKGVNTLGVSGLPTILFYKNGKEVHRFSGFRPYERFESEINSQL